jgi:hypothetical protein
VYNAVYFCSTVSLVINVLYCEADDRGDTMQQSRAEQSSNCYCYCDYLYLYYCYDGYCLFCIAICARIALLLTCTRSTRKGDDVAVLGIIVVCSKAGIVFIRIPSITIGLLDGYRWGSL